MRMVDLIEKTKNRIPLNGEEIHYIIDQYIHHHIPDYQMSAWMMAIYFNSLTLKETAMLTYEMMNSGELIDLSDIKGIKVDKHSTGGVGDKVSLLLAPMVSACGVSIAKMSGRGLGHTGGTLDKLESIPGYRIDLSKEEFVRQVNDIGISIIGQSEHLVLADKMMYALRDVSGTVDSIPLIASSIMSKKLASGCDAIMLDVKYGDGAFMKNKDDARELARVMKDIGSQLNKQVKATLSNMNQPLGYAIGNILEVKEVIDALNGNGPEDLYELCILSGIEMLKMAGICEANELARSMLVKTIEDGSALHKFIEMIQAQGGDIEYIYHPELFKQSKYIIPIYARESGYIHDIKALNLGLIAMKLGGGRLKKEDSIDYSVGLVLKYKVGDYVDQDDILVYVHSQKELDEELTDSLYSSFIIKDEYKDKPLIIEEII